MPDKLEFIIDKIKQTIELDNKTVKVGHAYYHQIDENFYNKIQIRYRERTPEKHNDGLISLLYFEFRSKMIKYHPDITIEQKKSEDNGRTIAEISLPKEKYEIKFI